MSHKTFEAFITACIVANTITLMAVHAGMSEVGETICFYINAAFSFLFFVEVLLRAACTSWELFKRDGWNMFDLIIVSVSIFDVMLSIILDQARLFETASIRMNTFHHHHFARVSYVGWDTE